MKNLTQTNTKTNALITRYHTRTRRAMHVYKERRRPDGLVQYLREPETEGEQGGKINWMKNHSKQEISSNVKTILASSFFYNVSNIKRKQIWQR